MTPFRLCVALSLSGLIAGCSPYAFTDEIGKFSSATTKLASSYDDSNTLISQERQRSTISNWVRMRPSLNMQGCEFPGAPNGSCMVGSADELKRADEKRKKAEAGNSLQSQAPGAKTGSNMPSGSQPPRDACEVAAPPRMSSGPVTSQDRKQPSPTEVFDALETYASGLAAVTNAADRAAFDAASAKLASGIGALGTSAAAANPGGAAIGPLATASANLVFWLVGEELDQRRYETLKDAVTQACRPVRLLAEVAGVILSGQQEVRLNGLADLIFNNTRLVNARSSVSVSSDAVFQNMVTGLLTDVASFNTLRETDIQGAGNSLKAAHDNLVLAIYDGKGQSDALIKAVGKFVDEAQAVQKASTNLHNASPATQSK